MPLTIRLEVPSDFRAVEDLTREAFWDVHVPGCCEHFVLHNLRQSPDFIPALSFVALDQGALAGHIGYSRATIALDRGGTRPVASFGPISVHPGRQRSGIGGALIRHSLQCAAAQGFTAVCIYGDPRYYGRFGFRCAERFDIKNAQGQYAVPLLALELVPGSLAACAGRFIESPAFAFDEAAFAAFERTFPTKESSYRPSQAEFQLLSSLRYPPLRKEDVK